MRLKFELFLAVLLLTGCPPAEQNTQSSSTPSSHELSASHKSASPHPTGLKASASKSPIVPTQHFKGLFLAGEGLQLFKACGSKEEIWVEDPQGDLLKKHAALGNLIDLEPVYVELEGTKQALTTGEGFASGYRQALHVSSVNSIRHWQANGQCFSTDFVAFGHRPEWNLQVLTKNSVYFKSIEGEFPIVESLLWQTPEQIGNQWKYVFRFRSPEAESMKVIFSKEPCQDGAKSYAFKASINFRGSNYEGCALGF
jgi:uncharacterized membrane protein